MDAEARGIRNGDIIKLYNDRGAVLGIAQVTERVMPGVIHSYEGSSKYDPIEPGKPGSVDRGGLCKPADRRLDRCQRTLPERRGTHV